MNNLAIRLAETGDRAGAVAPAQEAVDLRRASSGREPGLRTRPGSGVEQPGHQVV
ncbi:MAG: tetratricopeptide repeat protein [Candidatus Microthrix sp.]|nr:tetratricopeptide repeat protein [Candidatus Microthrix sp.]